MKNLDQLKLCVSLQNSLFNNFLAPKILKSGHINVFPIYFLKKNFMFILETTEVQHLIWRLYFKEPVNIKTEFGLIFL